MVFRVGLQTGQQSGEIDCSVFADDFGVCNGRIFIALAVTEAALCNGISPVAFDSGCNGDCLVAGIDTLPLAEGGFPVRGGKLFLFAGKGAETVGDESPHIVGRSWLQACQFAGERVRLHCADNGILCGGG
ncbi:hypothetical protein Barb7_02360 [Bacteroidales bacterium Barb7]|nr:hypothetical protein Barb7_02360 [Bacteroidales bacterium Barb7]